MSFNWVDYLTFATSLVNDPETPDPSEAALRSAISRAYYAAFRSALEFATSEGYHPRSSGDDHSSVRVHFRVRSPDPDNKRKVISTYLDRLNKARNQADYENTFRYQTPRAAAQLAVGMADKVIQLLDSLQE